jgi:hypothetical protein
MYILTEFRRAFFSEGEESCEMEVFVLGGFDTGIVDSISG